MATQSVSHQVPVPTVTHNDSSFAGRVRLAGTGIISSLGAKHIDLRQFANFRQQVWAVKQVKETETAQALPTLQQGKQKKISPQVKEFYSASADLMDASDDATANMRSTVLKALTCNGNSIVVKERQVELRRSYDEHIEVLPISNASAHPFQVIDKAKAEHYLSSDESSKFVGQKTYLLRADDGTEQKIKKNEVAFVTFINGLPNPPDTVCLTVNRTKGFSAKSIISPSVSAQGTSTTSTPLTSTQQSTDIVSHIVTQEPPNTASINSTPTATGAIGNIGMLKN